MQIPDDAVQINGDTLTIHLTNVADVDGFQFPALPGHVPVTVSFDVTYTKSGEARHVRPTSDDPLTPFTWKGKMWRATNLGTFSVAYNDGTFSAQGSFKSDPTNPDTAGFGEMGTETNGSFVEGEEDGTEADLRSLGHGQSGTDVSQMSGIANKEQPWDSPRFKGRVPLKEFNLWIPPAGDRSK